jgi:hypothetical protein
MTAPSRLDLTAHEHLTPHEVTALLEPESRHHVGRDLAAAAFLAEGCATCWEALTNVRPAASASRGRSPIRESVARVLTPGSWPALTADHFDAVFGCRHRPFGFASLVVEEAARLASEDPSLAVEPFSEATNLLSLLTLRQRHPALGDSLGRLHAAFAEAHAERGERSKAKGALTRALSCVGRDDPEVDVSTRIRLLRTQARYTRRFSRGGSPTLLYREALQLADPALSVRPLELTAELVSLPGWNPVEAVRRLTRALHASDALRSSSQAVVRAQALLRSAQVLVTAVEEDLLGDLRIPDVIAELAAELAEAEDLFVTVSNAVTCGLYFHWRGRLDFYHAPRNFEIRQKELLNGIRERLP